MRRRLLACLAATALLWAVVGVSVLALAVHEHTHHDHGLAHTHTHHHGVAVALHGHAHDGAPDHDHRLAVPLTASRGSGHHPTLVRAGFGATPSHPEGSGIARAASGASSRGGPPGPPPYLIHCVLLI